MYVDRGPWRFVWHGGRIADVYHEAKAEALGCVQVGDYDFAWTADEIEANRSKVSRADLDAAANGWMAESADDFERELPYL